MSPHDYRHLLRRWKAVARAARLPLRPLAGTEDVYFLQTPALKSDGGIYLSAGVHGDEAGPTEGLVAWAEQNTGQLAGLPLLIFPCLNPSGLAANSRYDATGRDMNRSFHNARHPIAGAIRRMVKGMRFTATMNLHEDYDAEGCYVYELTHEDEGWGRRMLAAAARSIPHDPRTTIDGKRANAGFIRRRVTRATFAKMGLPEAVWLWFEHTDRAFTFETPSEFAIERRAAAHSAVIEATVNLALS